MQVSEKRWNASCEMLVVLVVDEDALLIEIDASYVDKDTPIDYFRQYNTECMGIILVNTLKTNAAKHFPGYFDGYKHSRDLARTSPVPITNVISLTRAKWRPR